MELAGTQTFTAPVGMPVAYCTNEPPFAHAGEHGGLKGREIAVVTRWNLSVSWHVLNTSCYDQHTKCLKLEEQLYHVLHHLHHMIWNVILQTTVIINHKTEKVCIILSQSVTDQTQCLLVLIYVRVAWRRICTEQIFHIHYIRKACEWTDGVTFYDGFQIKAFST